MSSNEASPTTNESIPAHLRRKHPCVLCQQRKVKCDRNEPCQVSQVFSNLPHLSLSGPGSWELSNSIRMQYIPVTQTPRPGVSQSFHHESWLTRNSLKQNCTKARVQCISPLTLPPKKRKRRFPEAELLAKIRRYEEALKGYGADIDAINGDGVSSQGRTTLAAKQAETESNVMPRAEVVAQPARSLSIRRSLK